MFRPRSATFILCLALMAAGASATYSAAPGPKAPSADHTGIHWEPTFAAACSRAAREKKPVLVLHLFGKLDEEFC